MAHITIHIPEDLEIRFRRLTLEKYGGKRGRLSKGAVEALIKWCNEQEQ